MFESEWRQRLRGTFQLFQRGKDGKTRAHRRPPRFRPQLEALEDRLAPSTVQFFAAAETINETAGTFSIPVTLSGAPTQTVSTFASGFSLPFGEAFDAAGNLYVSNFLGASVSKVTPNGTVSTFVASGSGLVQPTGLAFDAAGNLYVADVFTHSVSQVTPAGVVSTFAIGFSSPEGLAFDAAGNLYVADIDTGTVSRVTPSGVVSTFATGFSGPVGLAFDDVGNLYVANAINNTVSRVTPAGEVDYIFVPATAGLNHPTGLAFDAGNLYVANENSGTVSQVTLFGAVSTFASGFSNPVGLAFDANGNLFVANFSNFFNSTVSEVSLSVSVPFTLGGTAMSGIDYSNVTASPLVIPFGQTTGNISGTLLADPGPSQTLTFTLGTPSGADLGNPSVNTLTIDELQLQATTSVVSSSANPSDFGQAVTFTVTVTANAPGNGTPTGTVTFNDGSTVLGSAAVDATGQASFTTGPFALAVGNHSITVTYSGDGNFTASTGSLSQTVLSAQEQIALIVTQVNALVGAGVLNNGNRNALITKLNAATADLNAGDTTDGVAALNDFISQINAFVNSGKLTIGQAQPFISEADQAIVSALGPPL